MKTAMNLVKPVILLRIASVVILVGTLMGKPVYSVICPVKLAGMKEIAMNVYQRRTEI